MLKRAEFERSGREFPAAGVDDIRHPARKKSRESRRSNEKSILWFEALQAGVRAKELG